MNKNLEDMKANELMIGDLINAFGVVRRVTSIHGLERPEDDGMLTTMVPGCEFPESNLSFRPCYAQPIPLTVEMLEKNGFKFEKNGFGLYSYRLVDGNDKVYLNGTFTELEYTNVCRNYDDPDEVNYGSNMEFPKPLELHQLQNILRVLGIEKEIIL